MDSLKIFSLKEQPDEFYLNSSDCLFYDPAWINVLESTYGFDFFTVVNEETKNYIILAYIDNNFEKKIISLPFSDYLKLENNTIREDEQLLRFVEKEYPKVPIIYKSTHSLIPKNSWALSLKSAYYHRIPTTDRGHLSELQKPTFKNKVRQAKKKGVEVRLNTGKDAVKAFYKLYYELRFNKFSSIPQSFVFFENIYEAFIQKEKGFFLEATFNDEVIASFLVLKSGNVLYHKWGCSALEYLNLRPNNLLYDYLIEYAFNNTFDAVDLGLSGRDKSYAGLVKFKESMGGVRNDINIIGNELAKRKVDENSPSKELVSSITKILVEEKADIKLTSKLSEIIYPFFV